MKVGPTGKQLELPSLSLSKKLLNIFAALAVAALLVFTISGAEMYRVGDLFTNSGNMVEYLSGFIKPDIHDWRDMLKEMWITIQIAVWGTLISILLAVPTGFLCSSNIVPPFVYQPFRRLMDILRSVNEMVFAMLFICAVGLGPFAGVLALALHTWGIMSKLFSEAVEAIDPGPVEAIRAVGATHLEEIVFGVIPQVLPLWISYMLYRFESNVRSASVLGMIGAGGIGMLLWDAIRGFEYGRTSAIILIIIGVVSLLDFLSGKIRKIYI